MTQKVLKVGKSAAVTIPKRSMEDLGLKIGDKVTVEVDIRKRLVVIRPEQKISAKQQHIAELTESFIERYRKDLEELAKK